MSFHQVNIERTPIIPPQQWRDTTAPLPPYMGTDDKGELWRRPPTELACPPPDLLPTGRPPMIVIHGSGNGRGASWVAGLTAAEERLVHPVQRVSASGSTVPDLAAAAEIPDFWRRVMNAGAPMHDFLRPVEPGQLKWWQRRNLDLAGIIDIREVQTWLAGWLEWAGVKTWADLRRHPGEARYRFLPHKNEAERAYADDLARYARRNPYAASEMLQGVNGDAIEHGLDYKVNIAVVVWETKEPLNRLYSQEELDQPEFVHWLFRKRYFRPSEFPFRAFKEVFLPRDVNEAFPWLASEWDQRSPAEAARWSMGMWPGAVPKVIQDPRTRRAMFIADGGHIHNQPNPFNDGSAPPFAIFNPRSKLNQRRPERQRRTDHRAAPMVLVLRGPRVSEPGLKGLQQARNLTLADRDAAYREGHEWGAETLAPEIERYLAELPARAEIANAQPEGRVPVVEPGLHGFRLIAAQPHGHVQSWRMGIGG